MCVCLPTLCSPAREENVQGVCACLRCAWVLGYWTTMQVHITSHHVESHHVTSIHSGLSVFLAWSYQRACLRVWLLLQGQYTCTHVHGYTHRVASLEAKTERGRVRRRKHLRFGRYQQDDCFHDCPRDVYICHTRRESQARNLLLPLPIV